MAHPSELEFNLPPYAYVPGGPWPHPTGSPQGHSAGQSRRPEPPIGPNPGAWIQSAAYRRGFALFNAGYYWEAHEVWEGLWHAHGRQGLTADLLRGLIKLAAAGVKVREHQPRGTATHARRAALLFETLRDLTGARLHGLDLHALATLSRRIADDPPRDPGTRDDRVVRVFGFRIVPDDIRDGIDDD